MSSKAFTRFGPVAAEWPIIRLREATRERVKWIEINDAEQYKRVTARVRNQGIEERDIVAGSYIKTKRQKVCRAGDLLVAEIDAKVGGFGIVPRQADGAIVSSHYFLFEIDPSRVEIEWLDKVIRDGRLQRQVDAVGSTNYAAIRPRDVGAFQIPLPPLAEQRAIAEVLGAVETTIAKTEALIDTVSQSQTALIKSYFGRLKAMKWSRVGKSGRWLSGGTPATTNERNWNGDIPWVCPKDIKAPTVSSTIDTISQEAADQIGIVEPGALLLVVRGMILARAVPSTINTVKCAFNQDVKAFVPNGSLQPRFLKLWLDVNEHKLLGEIETATHGTKRFPLERLNAFPIPVLSPKEQDKIVALAQNGYDRIASEKYFLSSLQAVRAALAQELLSGRLPLPESVIARHRDKTGQAATASLASGARVG